MSLVCVCVADETVQQYADACVQSRVEAEVGVLVGRRAAGKHSILQLVRSPDVDGAKPVSCTAAGGGGKKGKAGPGGLSLDEEWVVEHAAQVVRLLPGGLDVLGLYVLCPDASLAASSGPLASAVREVFAALKDRSSTPLLLHVDSVTGKLAAKACAKGAAPLQPCELKTAPVLPNLLTLRSTYELEIEATYSSGTQTLAAALQAAVEWELRHRVAPALALLGGQLPAPEAVLAEAAAQAGPALELQLLTPTPSANLRLAEVKAAAGALTRGRGGYDGVGVASMRGRLDCRAIVGKRETAAAALDALKADIQRSLRVRVDMLAEAAAQQSAAAAEAAQAAAAEAGGKAPPAAPPQPPLLRSLSESKAVSLALPRRAFVAAAGGRLAYCDYLMEGEGPAAVLARMGELLGLELAGEEAVESLERREGVEAPGKAGARRAGAGGAGALSPCSLMAAGAAGAALLAAGIGYLSLG